MILELKKLLISNQDINLLIIYLSMSSFSFFCPCVRVVLVVLVVLAVLAVLLFFCSSYLVIQLSMPSAFEFLISDSFSFFLSLFLFTFFFIFIFLYSFYFSFFDSIERLSSPSWSPSVDDLLRIRQKTKDPYEEQITYQGKNFV